MDGFTEASRGRTWQEIIDQEKRIGLVLPGLLKNHLMRQNGGESYYSFRDASRYLLAEVSLLPLEQIGAPLDQYLLERGVGQGFVPAPDSRHPERLIVCSDLDGSDALCLDYGHNQAMARPSPGIGYFDSENMALVAVAQSYEEFVDNMFYDGLGDNLFFLGLKSKLNLDELTALIGQRTGLVFQPGPASPDMPFARWYVHTADQLSRPLGYATITPNRYPAGTWQFYDDQDCAHILCLGFDSFTLVQDSYYRNITFHSPDTSAHWNIMENLYKLLAESNVTLSIILAPEPA